MSQVKYKDEFLDYNILIIDKGWKKALKKRYFWWIERNDKPIISGYSYSLKGAIAIAKDYIFEREYKKRKLASL
jgi:hypothetical protein